MIETIGISAIMPFIDIAMDFSVIHSNHYYQRIFTFFNFKDNSSFAIAFGLSLFIFYVFRAIITLIYTYTLAIFSETMAVKIYQQLFMRHFTMPYQYYVMKNYSLLIKAISADSSKVSTVILAMLTIISEVLVMLFLYALMLITNWKITLIFTAIMAVKLLFLIKPIATKIKQMGREANILNARNSKFLNRSFLNFKYIKLQDNNFLTKLCRQASLIREGQAKIAVLTKVLNITPRLFLETTGFSLMILLLVYLLYQRQANLADILSTLSLFVLAMYRLLPSINRITNSYNSILFAYPSINIVQEHLAFHTEPIGFERVVFTHNIQLNNIEFAYHDDNSILKNTHLTIKKGEKIAFTGASGCGKSTLVDLIIGLYYPKNGQLTVDGNLINQDNIQSWRSQIGYIPQEIYLFDGTVAENVCFNRPLDNDKLISVLKQANIFNFLHERSGSGGSGTEILLGENGVQLSGGQRQRIAIARALYGEPKILVLDEATSALDATTEKNIMHEIYNASENKTLIIIAHRLSTIEQCDKIYTISKGKIVKENIDFYDAQTS